MYKFATPQVFIKLIIIIIFFCIKLTVTSQNHMIGDSDGFRNDEPSTSSNELYLMHIYTYFGHLLFKENALFAAKHVNRRSDLLTGYRIVYGKQSKIPTVRTNITEFI